MRTTKVSTPLLGVPRCFACGEPFMVGHDYQCKGTTVGSYRQSVDQLVIAQAAELERLTADNTALRADAERYRFLRDGEYSESLLDLLVRPNTHKVAVDTAIDSARAKESDNS